MHHFMYEKLNKQRLELVDLLLKHGADKYLVTKLSISNLERLDKKSFSILKKWYGVAKTTTTANSGNGGESSTRGATEYEESSEESEKLDDDDDESSQEDSSTSPNENHAKPKADQELRPLSPMMASLCLDDVEIFSRLYKHHQNLFNYFKPDEDYELIYYAIRFQSKKCLIYLLCSTKSDLELPSLLEQQSKSKLATSLSLPMSLNKAACFNERCVKLSSKSCPMGAATNSMLHFQQQINKNVNTMFYIIENTRSSEIIKVLLKCGFDLCKREPLTGNSTLHCLFNANVAANSLKPKKDNSFKGVDKQPTRLDLNTAGPHQAWVMPNWLIH